MALFAIESPTPAAPVNARTTAGLRSITIDWDSVGIDAVYYEVWRAESGAGFAGAVLVTAIVGNTFTDAELDTTKIYTYYVRSVNKYGNPSLPTVAHTGVLGSLFNAMSFNLYASRTGTAVVSIDSIQAEIKHVTAGVETTIAFTPFTSTLTQSSGFGTDWVNPDNARVEDGSLATNTAASGDSENLILPFSDFSVPGTAYVTSLKLKIKGKASIVANADLQSYASDGQPLFMLYNTVWPDFAVDDTLEWVTVDFTSYLHGLAPGQLDVGSVGTDVVPATGLNPATSDLMLNAFAFGNGKDLGSGSSSTSGSGITLIGSSYVSGGGTTAIGPSSREPGTGWSTWYDVYTTGGTSLSPAPTQIFVESMIECDWTSLSSLTGNVTIDARLVLYNRTDSTVVKSEIFNLMTWGPSNALVRSQPVLSVPWVFYGSLTGLDTKTWDVRWQMRKTRTDASATLTMYFNRVHLESSVN